MAKYNGYITFCIDKKKFVFKLDEFCSRQLNVFAGVFLKAIIAIRHNIATVMRSVRSNKKDLREKEC